MLIDTNILIYSVRPDLPAIKAFVLTHLPVVSAITYVEALGFHRITPDELRDLTEMLDLLTAMDVDRAVLNLAVSLRQRRRMSLADAIMGATALVHGRTLVTRNVSDFAWIPGLRGENPFDGLPGSPARSP